MLDSTPDYIHDIYRSPDETLTNDAKAAMFMQLIDTHPQDKDYLLAWVNLMLWYDKKYDECIAHAQQTILQMTNSECIAYSYETWARCLERLEQPEEAVKIKEMALPFKKEGDWHLITTLAEDYEALGDTENQIKYLELLAADPDDDDERHFEKLAELYEDKGDNNNAAKHYSRLIRFHCDRHTWAISNFGRLLAIEGKNKEAIVQLKFCLFLDPDNLNAHYHLADIYEADGDTYLALHHYYETLRLRPDFAFVYVRLGALAFNSEGDIPEAITHMEKALELNTNPEITKTIYLNLSRLYDKIKDFDKHEYYKAKWAESLGLPPGFVGNLGDDEEGANR